MEMNEYLKHIRDIQLTQLEILKEFHSFCEKHDIKYILAYGTLLGAKRHKGFIPWDDDIDLIMLRSEYDRFVSLREDYSKDYYIQNYVVDDSIFPFTKIRKNNTKMVMKSVEREDFHQGVWIDIFPVDEMPSDKNEANKRVNDSAILLGAITSNAWSKVRMAATVKTKMARSVFYSLNKILGRDYYINKFENLVRQEYNTNKYFPLTDALINGYEKAPLFDKQDLIDVEMIEFENHQFYAPKNTEKYLTQMYGDYMQLPKEEDRIPHHRVIELEL